MIRSATSRLCSTVRVTGLLDWLHRTSHFFSLFMRTWKGVLTIRSPLSTSPAVRETDGAQSFSPAVAGVSRTTENRAERALRSSVAWHSMLYPTCSGSACPDSHPLISPPRLCSVALDPSELTKHAISLHPSGILCPRVQFPGPSSWETPHTSSSASISLLRSLS